MLSTIVVAYALFSRSFEWKKKNKESLYFDLFFPLKIWPEKEKRLIHSVNLNDQICVRSLALAIITVSILLRKKSIVLERKTKLAKYCVQITMPLTQFSKRDGKINKTLYIVCMRHHWNWTLLLFSYSSSK